MSTIRIWFWSVLRRRWVKYGTYGITEIPDSAKAHYWLKQRGFCVAVERVPKSLWDSSNLIIHQFMPIEEAHRRWPATPVMDTRDAMFTAEENHGR